MRITILVIRMKAFVLPELAFIRISADLTGNGLFETNSLLFPGVMAFQNVLLKALSGRY